jgi:hypothetical protein
MNRQAQAAAPNLDTPIGEIIMKGKPITVDWAHFHENDRMYLAHAIAFSLRSMRLSPLLEWIIKDFSIRDEHRLSRYYWVREEFERLKTYPTTIIHHADSRLLEYERSSEVLKMVLDELPVRNFMSDKFFDLLGQYDGVPRIRDIFVNLMAAAGFPVNLSEEEMLLFQLSPDDKLFMPITFMSIPKEFVLETFDPKLWPVETWHREGVYFVIDIVKKIQSDPVFYPADHPTKRSIETFLGTTIEDAVGRIRNVNNIRKERSVLCEYLLTAFTSEEVRLHLRDRSSSAYEFGQQ